MMTPDGTRQVFHGQYGTALTGMYQGATLVVDELGGDRSARFDGIRGDSLTIGFVTLEALSGFPAQIDDSGELTPEATARFIADARTQVAVAAGRPVLWACERAQDANVLDRLFDGPLADLRAGPGTVGIEVAHLPYELLIRQWRERADTGLWTPRLDRLPDSVFVSAPGQQANDRAPATSAAPRPPELPKPSRNVPVQPNLPPTTPRPTNFGLNRPDSLLTTSIVVPLGTPGPQTRTADDLPYCDITLGGETTATSGAETLIWSLCATRPPGTTVASVVIELTDAGGEHAIDTLVHLFRAGLLAQVDLSEPAAVYEFAQTYRLLPMVPLPFGGRPGGIVRTENADGAPLELDALLASIANEGMTSRNLIEACTPHGKIRPPDRRPHIFKSPNLLRRHPSVVHENGIVGWALDKAIPLIGEGVLAFDLAAN
ncbi:hypothetical protein [Stackebrandtia soli]|uniref:hypothetical protein n=1 Tax=Stackebrandtia soli TaxID=1892856 RepID=UPI0039E917C5